MGLDFTALIRYSGPSGDVLQAITRLERGEEGSPVQEVLACGLRYDFAFARHPSQHASWRSLADFKLRLSQRPALPSLEACLNLPSAFSLTFGPDTVWLYHTLRWVSFVTRPEWQQVMLAAVEWFCNILQASDCIITNDEHPAVRGVYTGSTFSEALTAAEREGEGQVARIEDLYINEGYADDLVFGLPGGGRSAVPLWDTHGYWRLKLTTNGSA